MKPDFKALASEFYYENHNEDTDAILVIAMEHIWSSHVEPLQKQLSDDAYVTLQKEKTSLQSSLLDVTNKAIELQKENERMRNEFNEAMDLAEDLKKQRDKNQEFIDQGITERDKLKSENKDLTHQLTERTESREEWKGIALKATSEITRLKEENRFMADLLKKNQDQLWMNDDHWKTLGIILHRGK